MLDLTSATLDWGKQCAMGMIDASRYLNESGGINGKRIELIVYDDKYKLSESQLAYRKFKDEEKVLGIYIQSTGANLEIARVAMKDRMFMFSGGTTAKLSNPGKYPYYFSLGPTYLDIARAGIKYIRDSWTDKSRDPKLVFMYPDNIYGREPLEAAKMYASEVGVEVGPDQIVNWPTLDASPQLLSMQAFEPDYALIVSTSMNAATILRDSKKLGIKTRFICNNRVFTEDLSKLAMGTAEGVLGIQSIAPYGANVPGMEKIVKLHDMRHPYHEPTVAYVDGWVNILVPMEAARIADEAGKLTSDGMKEVLEGFRHFSTGGLLPALSFYEDDHRATTQARIYAVERESLVAITDFIDVGRDKRYFDI
jgi:branched-chain amino acid transport system substrate-binding protein